VSLWTLNGHKPVIPVVIFLTPLKPHNGFQRIFRTWFPSTPAYKRSCQDGFSPYSLRGVSVASEPPLVQLGYFFRVVPPQPSSPAENFVGLGHGHRSARLKTTSPKATPLNQRRKGTLNVGVFQGRRGSSLCYTIQVPSRSRLEPNSTGSSFPASVAKPVPLAVISASGRVGQSGSG